MKFGTGSNNKLTQKYEKVKVQSDIRTSTHIYKRTNIPDFKLCYPCKCLARSLANNRHFNKWGLNNLGKNTMLLK